MLGLYVSDHPLLGLEAALRRVAEHSIRSVLDAEAAVGAGVVADGVGFGAAGAIAGATGAGGSGVTVATATAAGVVAAGAGANGMAGLAPVAPGGGWIGSVTTGGVITALSRRYTKRGELMATFVLEDLDATIEVMVFPKTMTEYGCLLEQDAVVVVRGRVDNRDEQPKLVAMEIRRPELVASTPGAPVEVTLPLHRLTDSMVQQLRELVIEHPGSSPVHLRVGRKLIKLPAQFNVDPRGGIIGAVEGAVRDLRSGLVSLAGVAS